MKIDRRGNWEETSVTYIDDEANHGDNEEGCETLHGDNQLDG